jgi:hypothetical protein
MSRSLRDVILEGAAVWGDDDGNIGEMGAMYFREILAMIRNGAAMGHAYKEALLRVQDYFFSENNPRGE